MKKLKANAVLSSFIFGISIILLCSFGTDTAYIILSRYKLQKIADATALEYAATRGRNALYEDGSQSDCNDKARNRIMRLYNTFGTGTLAFNITLMEEKTNPINKESVVKVQVVSKVLPAFLRFVGAREIVIHANSYAKTNTIEMTKEFDVMSPAGTFDMSYVSKIFGKDVDADIFKDETFPSRIADMVTSKAGFNGDIAIDFGYNTTGAADDFSTGGGFFIFAGYDTNLPPPADPVQWVDIGDKVKLPEGVTDATAYQKICMDPDNCYNCVNANEIHAPGSDGFSSKIVTFELSVPDDVDAKGHINRFNRLKIYKAGTIAGTTVNGTLVSNVSNNRPCSDVFIPPPGTPTMPYPPGSPTIFDTPARAKLIIMNNVSLINAFEYNTFVLPAGIVPGICALTPVGP